MRSAAVFSSVKKKRMLSTKVAYVLVLLAVSTLATRETVDISPVPNNNLAPPQQQQEPESNLGPELLLSSNILLPPRNPERLLYVHEKGADYAEMAVVRCYRAATFSMMNVFRMRREGRKISYM